jgi:hypothetical protein
LAAIAIATGGSSYFARIRGLGWAEGFGANLSAGFLGAFLTVVLIDRAIETERTRQARRVTTLALGRLRPPLCVLLELLAGWYKAAAKESRLPDPSARTLFTSEYFEGVQFLDFSKPGPQTGSSWFSFSAQIFGEFQTKVYAVLDAYAALIDTDTLELVERLLSSPIPGAIIGLANLPATDAAQSVHRSYNMLAGPGVIEELQAYGHLLQQFIEHFNRVAARSVSEVDLLVWREDVSPAWGSCRLTCDQLDRAAVKFMMAPGSRLPAMRAWKQSPN